MTNIEKLHGIAKTLRADADTFREQANFLDRYAARLDACSDLLDEKAAQEVLDVLKVECPDLFPS